MGNSSNYRAPIKRIRSGSPMFAGSLVPPVNLLRTPGNGPCVNAPFHLNYRRLARSVKSREPRSSQRVDRACASFLRRGIYESTFYALARRTRGPLSPHTLTVPNEELILYRRYLTIAHVILVLEGIY